MADGVAFSRSLTASTVASHDWLIKMLMVFGGALLGAQAWGVQRSWQVAPAVIAVLAFHELCHFAAMYLSGHREGDVYCVPLLGAAFNVRKDTATIWQRLFVYLAAPLSGIVLGVLCIDAAAHVEGSPRLWLLSLGAVALGVNLLNLLPFPPLDGGKLVESLAWWRWPYLRPALVASAAAISLGSWGLPPGSRGGRVGHDIRVCIPGRVANIGTRRCGKERRRGGERTQTSAARCVSCANAKQARGGA